MKNDDGFKEFLQHLVKGGNLEGAHLGITKIVIEKGESALTEKQRYVFSEHVIKPNTIAKCLMCGGNIPWSEMSMAVDTGLCSWCQHKVEKDD